MNVVGFID